jgi:hypothetical protein
MKIELTNKTEEEVRDIKESYPDGHKKDIGEKIYWVFENKNEYGV